MIVRDVKISQRWEVMREVLDERQRRLLVGIEAKILGRGGVTAVALATGVSRTTIRAGLSEIEATEKTAGLPPAQPGRTRQAGAGRKKIELKDETLLPDLLALVDSTTHADPESPLRWTCKSLRNLADELKAKGHAVSHVVVGKLLKSQNYSLQSNVKVVKGKQSPDRNAQFAHINSRVAAALQTGVPVISVDTKKKELVGAHKNAGQQRLPSGEPVEVKIHDFIDKGLGQTNPHGGDNINADETWASVETDADTAAFAVQTIRRWWFSIGKEHYPQARQLLITADGRGSNGHRVQRWKLELSRLAQETGLDIEVHHFPSGTSKWRKIEHRLFCFITMNWRGRPLISREVIVSLISNTKTCSRLSVRAELDTAQYTQGQQVSDEDFAAIKIERHAFHGDWNYCIRSGLN